MSVELDVCCICLLDIPIDDLVRGATCQEDHGMHTGCAQDAFTRLAKEGRIPICQGQAEGTGGACQYRFESPVIDAIMMKPTPEHPTGCAPELARILELLTRQALVSDTNTRQCPRVGCDQWINVGRPRRTRERGEPVTCTNHDFPATFCGTCTLYPYHRETTSCAVAGQARARWTLWTHLIIRLNNDQRPGPQYAPRSARKPGTEQAPLTGSRPSTYRAYIARNRERAIAAFKHVGYPLPFDIETGSFPRVFNDLMLLADTIDRSINEGPGAVTNNIAYIERLNDEAWKMANCRLCPRCNRLINRTEGCDAMLCGGNAHTTNTMGGCGLEFRWPAAKPYVSDLEAEFSLDEGLKRIVAEPDTPVPPRMLQIGDQQVLSTCAQCLQSRPTVFLNLNNEAIEPMVLCFHCVRAGLGSRLNADFFAARARRFNPASTLPMSHLINWRVYTPAGGQIGKDLLTTPALVPSPVPLPA